MSAVNKRIGRQSPSALLTVFGVTLAVAIITVTAAGVWHLREEALRDAEGGLASLNHALVEQTSGTIGSIDLVLMSTVEWLQGTTRARAVGAESMHQQLRARLSGLPQIKSLAVFRADGSLQVSSLFYPTPALNNYDDPYFAAHRDRAVSGLYVAVPRKSKFEDKWYLFFSRAIRGPGGRFEGVVMALVDPGYFADSYRRLRLVEGGSVALVREDGYMLARYPQHAEWLGKSLAPSELYTRMLAKGGHAIIRTPVAADGVARIISGEVVPGFPLRINVTVTEETALEEWRRSAFALAAAAAGTILLIVLLVGGLRRQLQRQETLGLSLRESEARFRSLVELSSDWYWEQDQNYRFVYRHGAVLDGMGLPPANDYGKTRWEMDFSNMTETDWAAHRALLARREEFRDLLLARRGPDGKVYWATISGRPVFDEHGEFRGYRGVGRDITRQVLAEQALRQSEDTARALLNASTDMVFLLDAEGVVLAANEATEKVFGVAAAELIGRSIYARFLPDRVEYRRAIGQQSVATGQAVRFVDSDGERIFDSRIYPVRDEAGQVSRLAVYSRDITEQKHAEEQLLIEHAAIESSINAIAMASPEGKLTYVNQAFLDLWGLEHPGEAIGRSPAEFWSDAGAALAVMESLARDGRWQGEMSALRRDGSTAELQVSAHMVAGEGGRPLCLMASFVEIAERKRAERALLNLNQELEQRVRERTAKLEAANKELETFTYSVSHDLKAPLRGIDGYSQLLLDAYSDRLDDEGRRFLHNVRQAAQHMGQLINDLLAYSRLERSDVRAAEVDLQALVESILEERADEIERRGVAVSVALSCRFVTADRDGLAMALRNLLENALKFSRDAAHPGIEITGQDTGTACIVSVRDNGVGFDMKYHDKIFAIFQRLHRSEDYPGTGIGLAIVKKAMERMGGRAWAESEPGKGAIFYLEIQK